MAAPAALDQDILLQLQALLVDRLQVVSYKWLSRSFSVPSNTAKSLLQEFVDKHGKELQVIYSVSGRLRNNGQMYCVKLASGPKLEEVRQEFEDPCSVQIYSLQACIPNDSAVLWNTEFTQAEELFNRPFSEDNCLRDNRFCGVSNSFVKWTADIKHGNSCPPKPENGTAKRPKTETNSISVSNIKDKPLSHREVAQNFPNVETSNRSDNEVLANRSSKVQEPVRKVSKKNGQAEKSSSNSGAIASLWGRAPAKPKPSKSSSDAAAASEIAVTAEAQICAKEAVDGASSDDEEVRCKRDTNSVSNRKRRVVFDDSDDDDEDNVVSLATPPSPKREPHRKGPKGTAANNTKEDIDGRDTGLLSKSAIENENDNNSTGICLKKKVDIPSSDNNKSISVSNAASTSPKRRKVLKTRIDERGREVSEFVWEGEAAKSETCDKDVTSTDTGPRTATLPNKPQASGANERNPAANKASTTKKSSKAGPKDAKQGNIMSFFKKI